MSGIDLRVERVRLRLRQEDVALAAGVSRQRIAHLESLDRVPPAQVRRYLSALEQLRADLQ